MSRLGSVVTSESQTPERAPKRCRRPLLHEARARYVANISLRGKHLRTPSRLWNTRSTRFLAIRYTPIYAKRHSLFLNPPEFGRKSSIAIRAVTFAQQFSDDHKISCLLWSVRSASGPLKALAIAPVSKRQG